MNTIKKIAFTLIFGLAITACDTKTQKAVKKIKDIADAAESSEFIDNQKKIEEDADFVYDNIEAPFEDLTSDLPNCNFAGEKEMSLDRGENEYTQEEISLFDDITTEEGREKLTVLYQKAYDYSVKKIAQYESKVTDASSDQVKKQLVNCKESLPKSLAYINEFKELPLATEDDKCKFVQFIRGGLNAMDSPMMGLSYLTMLESFFQLEKLKVID